MNSEPAQDGNWIVAQGYRLTFRKPTRLSTKIEDPFSRITSGILYVQSPDFMCKRDFVCKPPSRGFA